MTSERLDRDIEAALEREKAAKQKEGWQAPPKPVSFARRERDPERPSDEDRDIPPAPRR